MPRTVSVHITQTDKARDPYYYVPIDVPVGTTRIDVTMAYPKADDCIIDLGMLDPRAGDYPTTAGFRGWSGGFRDRFFVATDDATPGYIHGEMPAGRWRIILGLYKLPPHGADVTLTVSLDSTPRALTPQPQRTLPVRQGAGWYKGDLHSHTYHSDAAGAPEVLHAAAKQAGLDFLAVCDHNTITQRRYFHPHSSSDLVFIRGMEVTTAEGHANVFGVDDWIDFRMPFTKDAVDVLAAAVHRHGGLLSINHDKPNHPWTYPLPDADCQEVWQTAWFAHNWTSLARWQARLASGLRLAAIGGSDYHQPAELQPEGPLVLGRPTTVLYLHELSEDAVLAAMKAGRGYVTENPAGPHLSISIGDVRMGGEVPAGPLEATAETRRAKGDRLVWIDATGILAEQEIADDDWTGHYSGAAQKFLRAEIVAVAAREKLVAEFRGAFPNGELPWGLRETDVAEQPVRRTISNPIYLAP